MPEGFQQMIGEMRRAADRIKSHSGNIRVITHYDTDGITSAAIMVKTLFREGKSFHLTLVKQLGEKIVAELVSCKDNLIIFLDLGSGQLENINKLGKCAIIVDHHQQQGKPADSIIHINAVECGITENISSSGMVYFLSKTLDQNNKDLSEIAILGAIGDSQMGSIGSEWSLFGLNRLILEDAVESKKISVKKGLRIWGRTTRPLHKALEYCTDPYIPNISNSESGAVQLLQEIGIQLKKGSGDWRTLSDLTIEEQRKLASAIIIERVNSNQENPGWIFGDVYDLLDKDQEYRDANEFATLLNACGKLKKAHLGISLCLNDQKAFAKSKSLFEEYRRSVGTGINLIKTDKNLLKQTEKAIYILMGDKISEHIVSNVISVLSKSFDASKPVFAFANSEEGVKISARASDLLVKDGLNLKDLMSSVASALGGEGGGHSAASGATIPAGAEEAFISAVETFLSHVTVTHEGSRLSKEEPNDSNIKLNGVIVEKGDLDGQGRTTPTTTGGSEAAKQEGASAKAGGLQKMERKGLVLYLKP